MKMRTAMVGLALIAPLSLAWGANPVDPETLTKIPCSDLHFSKAFLAKWPAAPAACLEGRQDKSGHKYGKFSAKVYLNSKDRTTFNLIDAKGDTKTTFSIKPAPGATLTINGEKTRFQDLRTEQVVTFWVSETRLAAQELPAATSKSWSMLPPTEAPK
jgi:hypothetical protein